MNDFLNLLNDDSELQAAARELQLALDSQSRAFKATSNAIGWILQWCQRDDVTNDIAERRERRRIRRERIKNHENPS